LDHDEEIRGSLASIKKASVLLDLIGKKACAFLMSAVILVVISACYSPKALRVTMPLRASRKWALSGYKLA
jgi:hypothetical protein